MTTSELITLNNHRNKQSKIRTTVRGDIKVTIARLYDGKMMKMERRIYLRRVEGE